MKRGKKYMDKTTMESVIEVLRDSMIETEKTFEKKVQGKSRDKRIVSDDKKDTAKNGISHFLGIVYDTDSKDFKI
jgi:hypothetical protein